MSTTLKEQCVNLRKQGYTLPEIVERTGRPKSTVYFHIRNLPLSPERKDLAKKAASARIRSYASSRKGKSSRGFQEFNTWTSELVLLVAHLIFDGELSVRGCNYNNRSNALIERVKSVMKKLYEFEPKIYLNPKTGVTKISYNNVALGAYMQRKANELLREVPTMPREYTCEFLRAFFDDEGSMDFRPLQNKRRIRGYQKDIEILAIVQSLLAGVDISSQIVLPNEVQITGKSELLKFQAVINFSPGVRINGNRTNSLWEEPLEKRELLQRAIDSFKS
ncbi:hypothetical protein BH11PAT2_BH11PAT2_08900 [soil metagenome]